MEITRLRDVLQLCTKQVGTGEIFKQQRRALQLGKKGKRWPKRNQKNSDNKAKFHSRKISP